MSGFAFLRIHPFNFLVALFARLLGPVAYWKAEGLPRSFVYFFEAIEPSELFDAGEWNKLVETAHTDLASQSLQVLSLRIKLQGVTADMSHSWLHWFVHQFELDVLVQHLALGWSQKKKLARIRVFSSAASSWAPASITVPNLGGVGRVKGSVLADRLWELASSIRAIVATAIRIYSSPRLAVSVGCRYRFLFIGIGPANDPVPGSLDFTFLARFGHLPPNECLYILRRTISSLGRRSLAKSGIAVLSVPEIGSLFNFKERTALILGLVRAILQSTITSSRCIDALSGMIARAAPVVAVARRVQAETVIAALDDGILEPPAIAFLSALGLRTIVWQHALIGFGHSPTQPFHGRSLEQSVYAADEVCVWTPADQALLNDRALPSVRQPRLHLTGPAMAGDSRWLSRPKWSARDCVGIAGPSQTILSVFDLPTFVPGYRRPYRIPLERISEDVHDAFYGDLIKILNTFPKLSLLLKPKRAAADPRFYVGRAFRALTDPNDTWALAGRVNLVDPDIDPYLPIAAADFCIGMPFTSPVVAALNAGRPATWYDPVGFAISTYPPELEAVLARGLDQLTQLVAKWISGEAVDTPPSLVANVGDPGERLATIIARRGLSRPESEKTLEEVT